jgi:hypothetical protein
MVFHSRNNNFIAFFTELPAKAMRYKIDRFGSAFSENYLSTMLRVYKLLHYHTGFFGQAGRFPA